MASDNLSKLLKQAKKTRSFSLLARALSVIDSEGAKSFKAKEINSSPINSFRIGITGPPGAGKSTLISEIITHIREKKLSVAVLAVDPSSPFTQGAVLGDRIRMSNHFSDSNVFLRSLGSRGAHGGINASTYLMARALEYFGFDFIIIETVGVGQTELEILNISDLISVVLVPESGDSIQAMKAGLLEISDVFVINKSDRPGADQMAQEIKDNLKKDTFQTTASRGVGVDKLVDYLIKKSQENNWKKSRIAVSKIKAEARALIEMNLRKKIEQQVSKIKNTSDLKRALVKYEK